jgi:hypothetical protein
MEAMEVPQSFNYNPLGFESEEMAAVSAAQFQFGDESLHVHDCSKFLVPEVDNTDTVPENPLLESNWMSDFTSVVNGFECIEGETVIGANEGLPNQTHGGDLVNGLGAVYTNFMSEDSLNKILLNHPVVGDSNETDTNNGQLIGEDDFDLSKQLGFCDDERKASPVTLANSENTDAFVGAIFGANRNIRDCEVPQQQRAVESTRHFEATKRERSDLIRKDLECTQTYSKRKRAKTSDEVDGDVFETTNLTASDSNGRVTQLASVAGRSGRNRSAKSKNRRSETRFSSTYDDSTPVSSPEAEVPHSPGNINDDELINLETKELNKRVKFLPKAVVQDIKHRRRTLKNRGYARSCREKKMSETSTLQRSNGDLEKELATKKLELQLMILDRNSWKQKCENLASICAKHGMQIEQ